MAATELANRGDAPEAAALVLDDDDATAAVASPVGDAEAAAVVAGGAAAAPSCYARACAAYQQHSFLCNVILSICVARAAPTVGAKYLAPRVTASQIAVAIIFFLTGLGLRTNELVKALTNYRFNAAVQLFNLGALPLGAWCVAMSLKSAGLLAKGLANGVVVCAALPMTVNMVIVLTKSAGGDEAAAVFNSAFGNLLGVFATPGWVVALLGKSSSVDFLSVLLKLARRVLAPLFVGQCVQKFAPSVAAFAKKHKPRLKKAQELLLTYIVYCAFCLQFRGGEAAAVEDVLAMVVVQCLLLFAAMALAWVGLGALGFPAKLRVMGLFGCTHKTVAMGVPLIDAIYGDDDNKGLYLLPLLVWHPTQLIVGSFLTAKLHRWVADREARDADPKAVAP